MKKLLSALALVMVVAGCSKAPDKPQEPTTNEPAAMTTLDAATFANEFDNAKKIKVFIGTVEDPSKTLIEVNLEDDAVIKEVKDMVSSLSLTKAEKQDQVYGNPLLFVDLNTPLDSNYARIAMFENMVVIQTKTEFVNYDLTDDVKAAFTPVMTHLVELYAQEGE